MFLYNVTMFLCISFLYNYFYSKRQLQDVLREGRSHKYNIFTKTTEDRRYVLMLHFPTPVSPVTPLHVQHHRSQKFNRQIHTFDS